jgi:signal transduction histidine kinase
MAYRVGLGISTENQMKLFSFMHIRPDLLLEGGGSGLGLSLCKQIVKLHGGTIGVTSTEGRGIHIVSLTNE